MKRNKLGLRCLLAGICLFLLVCITCLWYQRIKLVQYNAGERSYVAVIATIVIIILASYVVTRSVKLYRNITEYDQLTGIHSADWILHKGGSMYYRKQLFQYVCMFANVQDFKYINKKIGNPNGDKALRDFAQIIDTYLNNKGYMGRLGGDNFLIFLKEEYVKEFISFNKNIYVDVNVDGEVEQIKLSLRAGISPVIEEIDYQETIAHSSIALGIARADNKNFVWFEDDMIRQIVKDKEIHLACKQAFRNKEFVPYYQPKVDAKSRQLCGAEALVRWNHDGKVVSPGVFVPVLERNGDIVKLDFYMLECVCRDIRHWISMGLEPVRVSVNFSKLHLRNEQFSEKIYDMVKSYGIDPKYIEIELTESSCEEDFDKLRKFINTIRGYGFVVSIDDFGTGYSSLSMLRGLNAEVIKLDRSFLISAYDENPFSKKFIQDIIRMIDNQNEKILCEGVETEDVLDFLTESGCHIIQGFYFDKPLIIEDFERRLLNPQY